MSTHYLAHRSAMYCSCGALLYEEDDGRIICEASGAHLPLTDPRHLDSCQRDEDGAWTCRDQCPVRKAQRALL